MEKEIVLNVVSKIDVEKASFNFDKKMCFQKINKDTIMILVYNEILQNNILFSNVQFFICCDKKISQMIIYDRKTNFIFENGISCHLNFLEVNNLKRI